MASRWRKPSLLRKFVQNKSKRSRCSTTFSLAPGEPRLSVIGRSSGVSDVNALSPDPVDDDSSQGGYCADTELELEGDNLIGARYVLLDVLIWCNS